MQIISIPTKKLDSQNSIFSMLYTEAEKLGLFAVDMNIKTLILKNLDGFVVHFPEHFANNSGFLLALIRSTGLLASALIAKLRGIPIIWVAHNAGHLDIRHPFLSRLVMKFFLLSCNAIICLSKHSVSDIKKLTLNSNCSIHLIRHPSYNHEKIFLARKPARNYIMLCMPGKQVAYKDPNTGLDWYIKLNNPTVKLRIAGEIIECDRDLKERINAIDSNNLEIANRRFSDEELLDSIHDSDFILLPYNSIANSGMAILALSAGRPIITSNLPLFLELQEFFGPVWVRTVDGKNIDTHLSYKPQASDYSQLLDRLNQISLKQIASKHFELIRALN